MRLATVDLDGELRVAVDDDGEFVPLPRNDSRLASMITIAASGRPALDSILDWLGQAAGADRVPRDEVRLAAPVPRPGAIFAIGLNYGEPGEGADRRPQRPLVYGKLPSSVVADRARIAWDRDLTSSVDAEVELAVVIGTGGRDIPREDAMHAVFGYTCLNDVSSRDEWLDGDQWLLGKSMPGFCPLGPVVVTPDALVPDDLRLGCDINGTAIQDGSTRALRYSIPEIIAFLSRHVALEPGDVVATGTPARLDAGASSQRHLEPGDVVRVWIEGIGELSNTVG